METKTRNRILSILLAAVVAIGMFAITPLTANAATGSIDIGSRHIDDISASESGLGWQWSSETNTLALTSAFTGKYIRINCKPGDMINLTFNGNITISDNADPIIRCDGSLSISASGGKLSLSSGITGIQTGGSLTIRGNADVAIATSGSGIVAGGNVAINGAKLDVSAGGDAVTATGDVSINSSSGSIKTSATSGWAIKAGGSLSIGGNMQVMGYDGADYTVLSEIAAVAGYNTFVSESEQNTAMGNIRFAPLINASILPVNAMYDKSVGGDITASLNTGSYELVNVKNGLFTLNPNKDYTLVASADSSNTYTITFKESYIIALIIGTHTLVLNMSEGRSLEFVITIVENASISPTAATFVKNSGKDVIVTLNRANNNLNSLRNGTYTLQPGTDYTGLFTVNSNIVTYTIDAAYLNRLTLGNHKFTFVMSSGVIPILTITVTDTDAAAQENTSQEDTSQSTEAAAQEDTSQTADTAAQEDTTPSPGLVVPDGPFPFYDVLEYAWFYNDVKIAWQTGLIDGRTPTAFAPDDNLTYAEAVKLAACMHELYTTGKVTLGNGSPWYQSYVDYARANGIISSDYNWNVPATRAGYMAIFANALPAEALAIMNDIPDGAIPDVPMTHPFATAIYKLYRAGILQGVNMEHNCNPDSNIRRSEVAAILTRMMNPAERIHFGM